MKKKVDPETRLSTIVDWMKDTQYAYHGVDEIRRGIDRYLVKKALRDGLIRGVISKTAGSGGGWLYGLRQ